MNSTIYLGIKGTVIAIDRTTGQERWRTPLRGRDFVNVTQDEDLILASTKGEIYALDAATGSLRWKNTLDGMGWGIVTIVGAANTAAIEQKKRRDREAAGAGAGAAS